MMNNKLKSLLSVVVGATSLLFVVLTAIAVTLNESAELLASDGAASHLFGESVALDGDTAIIGASGASGRVGASGAAYVFTVSASVWSEQQKLSASDGDSSDVFGFSVAVDADTAVIGALLDDDNGANAGAAYVFTRSGSTWTEQAKLAANDGAASDDFGRSVAIDGDTIVVGANLDDDDGTNSGSAYVFTRSGTTWTEQAKLTASDATLLDQFGFSVSVDGDTAVVGAPFGDPFLAGSAYVFTRSGTVWIEQQKLKASDATNSDFFGWSVAVSADTAVISAHGDDDNGSGSGSTYVFTRSGTTWSEQAKLSASDGAALDRFGEPLALDGDIAVIGARDDDDQGSDSGSAYLFDLNGASGTVNEIAKLLPSDGAAFDSFGISVAVSGSTALVGAWAHDHQGSNSGTAYVFGLLADDEGPVTFNTTAMPNPVAVNNGITLTANVDDTTTGGSNIASADYTIDGGAPVSMAAQDGTFDEVTEVVTAAVPGFAAANVHQLCVSGTDAAGNSGAENCTLLAVYDPSAGFVTGGGWIDSPADACHLTPACAGQTGKANFGFVSKYQQGAQMPTGNTKFVFKAGDLNFDSAVYDWLVVVNHKAQYKGVGTINGGGNYGFMLSAIDADLTPSTNVDLFRIKIWDKDNGDMVVYDNELGSGENADPTTAIGGGSIMIHNPGPN